MLISCKTTLAATQESKQKSNATTLIVPATIDILEIDGQRYQSPSLIDGSYSVSLSKGNHSLIAQYYQNWNTIDESGNIIKWKPVEIRHTFKASSGYSLEHTKVEDIDDAESLVNTPEIWLSSDQQKIIAGVVLEEQNNRSIYSTNKHLAQTPSKAPETIALQTQIQALQQEVNTLKNKKTNSTKKILETFTFSNWQAFKKQNPEQYKRFKDYQEYEDFLEYRRKINK